MAARDVYDVSGDFNYVFNEAPRVEAPRESKLRQLFRKLELERAEDQVLNTFIRQLEIYTRQVPDERVVGLEAKFDAAGRRDQTFHAASLKEYVYANIKANVFSPTYQLIVATLMARVHERFRSHVRPVIEGGASVAVIDQIVATTILDPIAAELDDCPQFQDVAIDYVRGMVYFLTGNCHIRWD